MVEKIKKEIQDRNNVFWALVFGIIILTFAYIYFLGSTVYSVAQRQNTEKSITRLENDIEKLETSYFNLKEQVTADLAKSKGFTGISLSTTYISRKPLGKILTLNNEI